MHLLTRAWGRRRQYRIVEDGDRKGNQSAKGIEAKRKAHIEALTLPPRTPSLMPLDYSLWAAILDRMDETAPGGTETKGDYVKRLAQAAHGLPRGYVRKVLERMKANLVAIVDAKGGHPKND